MNKMQEIALLLMPNHYYTDIREFKIPVLTYFCTAKHICVCLLYFCIFHLKSKDYEQNRGNGIIVDKLLNYT